MRAGKSLIEVLVVFAIIGTLMSLTLPAVQKVRATADTTACLNNMRQLALGVTQFNDTRGGLPWPRLCPAPWQGGTDPYCAKLTNPAQFTGPAEQWWAPYDNRPGSTPTAAASDYSPAGLIWPFVPSQKAFRCPDGADRTPGSPTQGQTFQVSYALVPTMGGQKLGQYVGATVTEHDDAPACWSAAATHPTAWPADPAARAERHGPKRHLGALAIARHDGSVSVGR